MLVGVIVLRLVWVFAARYCVPARADRDPALAAWTCTIIVAWAGMRGVVTLAAAFLIPEDTPTASVLLLIAFTVTAGTLFLQGLSLPWLARRLRVPAPDPAADALARAELLQPGVAAGLRRPRGPRRGGPAQRLRAEPSKRLEYREFVGLGALGAGDR